ncbi:MAG: fumarate hydratase [Oscillospiraceae bacterium]
MQRLCIQANTRLPQDVKDTIAAARRAEDWSVAQDILDKIIENYSIGGDTLIRQDTGMACVFLEIGQDVHINGPLTEAVNEGVRRGLYRRLPAQVGGPGSAGPGEHRGQYPRHGVHRTGPGEQVKITVASKGFGSENMSRIAMLKPSDGLDGVKQFIPGDGGAGGLNPCPPIVVGVGTAAPSTSAPCWPSGHPLREMGTHNGSPFYARLEQELLEKINALGIRTPGASAGRTHRAGGTDRDDAHHIAGLPCAVNINCHVPGM